MKITGKQAHVLADLERVEQTVPKIGVTKPRLRFQLDGWDCTYQIIGLVVREKVRQLPSGVLARLPGKEYSA